MNIFKAFAISFSLYSKIPMPQFMWKDKDMKYSLIFFPWVGIVIGGLLVGLYYLGIWVKLPDLALVLMAMALPLIVTGGFHVDGFMDVNDGIHSYADKEKKLEILKDPHIGAFSVISLIIVGLIYGAAISVIMDKKDIKLILLLALSFVISRCLSGIGVLKLSKAKKDGMLRDQSEVESKAVFICLCISLLICGLSAAIIDPLKGGLLMASALLSFVYYRWKSYREFGGITGDTAGFFVVISEISMAVVLAALGVIL